MRRLGGYFPSLAVFSCLILGVTRLSTFLFLHLPSWTRIGRTERGRDEWDGRWEECREASGHRTVSLVVSRLFSIHLSSSPYVTDGTEEWGMEWRGEARDTTRPNETVAEGVNQRKVDRVLANHSLSSTASQGRSNIPLSFLLLGLSRQARRSVPEWKTGEGRRMTGVRRNGRTLVAYFVASRSFPFLSRLTPHYPHLTPPFPSVPRTSVLRPVVWLPRSSVTRHPSSGRRPPARGWLTGRDRDKPWGEGTGPTVGILVSAPSLRHPPPLPFPRLRLVNGTNGEWQNETKWREEWDRRWSNRLIPWSSVTRFSIILSTPLPSPSNICSLRYSM